MGWFCFVGFIIWFWTKNRRKEWIIFVCLAVCACVCVCVCVHAYVRACVRVCVCVLGSGLCQRIIYAYLCVINMEEIRNFTSMHWTGVCICGCVCAPVCICAELCPSHHADTHTHRPSPCGTCRGSASCVTPTGTRDTTMMVYTPKQAWSWQGGDRERVCVCVCVCEREREGGGGGRGRDLWPPSRTRDATVIEYSHGRDWIWQEGDKKKIKDKHLYVRERVCVFVCLCASVFVVFL